MSLRARTDALIAAVDIRRTTTIKGDVRALAVYADAFMFSCSAKGIVKQAGPIY